MKQPIRSDEWFTDEIAASLNLDRNEVKDVVIHVRQGHFLEVNVTKWVNR